MDIQQEIRVLNTAVGLIASYVNNDVCCFPEDRSKLVQSVLPRDDVAKKYFYILLLEVIAGVHKEIIPGKKDGDNLLALLNRIASAPRIDPESTTLGDLIKSVQEFQVWLSHEFEHEIYSSLISNNIKINLTRKDALYLVGNRCKHSLLRSNAILDKLTKIYKKGGADMNVGYQILILEDIDNWLFDDFGGYHFTKICELSSKVCYGIKQYVRPVYDRCLMKEDDARYSYIIPECVSEEESKYEYYELLNRIGSMFLPEIKTSVHLEDGY
ncbi:hypothetical protein A3197_03330 [Candidatus Thiodiazotropha endoloripes]|nr:hypothetical protein A3197_03330 [Candidatus Thiodiazotropha endoloripes]